MDSSSLSLRLIQSFPEWASLADQWDDLLESSSTNSVFQSWRFLSTWWEHFGADSELAILTAERDGELVGIAPFHIKRGPTGARRHLRHLAFLGSLAESEGLLFDFPVRPGLEAPVLGACFAEGSPLFQLDWDQLYLPMMPVDSPCLAALESAANPLQESLVRVPQEESPYIEFRATWDEFLATRSAKFRRNLRASLRGMTDKMGATETRAGEDLDVAELHRHLSAFSTSRWLEEKPAPPSDAFLAFERALLERFQEDGLLEFHAWRKGDEMIALNCAFGHAGSLWGYQMAWNPAFQRVSPGNVAMASVVQHGIEGGYRGLHMLLGGAAYKKAWAASSIELCRLEAIRPGSVRGRLFDLAKQARHGLHEIRAAFGEERGANASPNRNAA